MSRLPSKALAVASLAAAAALAAAAPSQAAILGYNAVLNGAGVTVPTASLGTGDAFVTIDTVANTMRLVADFTDLGSSVTGAHIHCCTATPGVGAAGVATPIPAFPGFPLNVTAGSYDQTFDLTSASSYNPAFVTAAGSVLNAESTLLAGFAAGEAYFTLHTTNLPSGEIAGFFASAPVPEPATWALMIAGFGLMGATLRRRRSLAVA